MKVVVTGATLTGDYDAPRLCADGVQYGQLEITGAALAKDRSQAAQRAHVTALLDVVDQNC